MRINSVGGLTATDSFGRKLSASHELPERKTNKRVGVFYFLWHGAHYEKGVHRFDDMLEKYSIDTLKTANSPFYDAEWGAPFFWGEPLYGFYYATDEWVIRRHVEMLTLADVDFLIIDTTNLDSYIEQALLLMKNLDTYRIEGFKTPQIMFYTHTDSSKRMQELYEGIYQKKYYPETWFSLRGKPAIVGNLEEASAEVAEFFTMKTAQWPNEDKREGGFPWMDFTRPQRVFSNADGSESILNVSVAQNSAHTCRFGDSYFYGDTGNCGRSFHDGEHHVEPDSYQYGYNFQEQWDRAIEADPEMVFVTGWNEWTAGVWRGEEDRPVAIFDCLNGEYSRDIEPMRGGYGDAYYLQMVENIRRYKGVDKAETTIPFRAESSLMDGWDKLPGLRHFSGSVLPRDGECFEGSYQDNSGRNDILETKVAQDAQNWYFYARTADSIVPDDGMGEWMRVYVRTGEGEESTTGYTHCLNIRQKSNSMAVMAQWVENQWKETGEVTVSVVSNEMVVCVGKDKLNEKTLEIKWADARKSFQTPEDFYLYGSVAPTGRFNQMKQNDSDEVKHV